MALIFATSIVLAAVGPYSGGASGDMPRVWITIVLAVICVFGFGLGVRGRKYRPTWFLIDLFAVSVGWIALSYFTQSMSSLWSVLPPIILYLAARLGGWEFEN